MVNTTIHVGDAITFRAATRWSDKRTTRIVTGFTEFGWPTVRFGGHQNFVVRPSEVSRVQKTKHSTPLEVDR